MGVKFSVSKPNYRVSGDPMDDMQICTFGMCTPGSSSNLGQDSDYSVKQPTHRQTVSVIDDITQSDTGNRISVTENSMDISPANTSFLAVTDNVTSIKSEATTVDNSVCKDESHMLRGIREEYMVSLNEDVNSDCSTQQVNSTIDIDSSDSSDSDEKDFTDSKERVHTKSMNNMNGSTREDRRNGDNHAGGEVSYDDTAEDYSQSKGFLPDSRETKPVSTIKSGNRTSLRRQVSMKHCPSISSNSSAKSDEGDGQPCTDMDDSLSANVEPELQCEKECQERVTILPQGENNNSSTDTKETQKSSEDVSYKFHQTCGPNVELVWRKKGAKRKRKAKTSDGGTVMTETRLKDDIVFQIVIEPTESDQARRINIGATSNNPNKKSIPDMRKPQEGDAVNILWSNRNFYAGGKYKKSLSEDIDECTVGDTVGIKKTKNSLIFYLNGEEVGNLDKGKCDWNNKELYGVVDLYGKGTHVSITKNNYTQEIAVNLQFPENFPVVESYDKKRVKPVMEQMRKVIIAFKRQQKDVERFPCNAASLVNRYILKPASSFKSDNLRQLGDHLARLGAATEFKKLLQHLFSNDKIKDDKKTQDYLSGREIVLETCSVYSKASRELNVSFGESGLLEFLITQIMESNEGDNNEGATSNSNEDLEDTIRMEMLRIMYHCSTLTQNRRIFHKNIAFESSMSLLKSDDIEFSALLAITMTNIAQTETQCSFTCRPEVISHLHDVLKKSIKGTKLYDIDTLNIEVTKTLGFLALEKKNATTIMEKGSVQLLLSLIKRGELAERETAAFALLQLSRHDYEDYQKNHFLPVPKKLDKVLKKYEKVSPTLRHTIEQILRTTDYNVDSNDVNSDEKKCEYQSRCTRFMEDKLKIEVFRKSDFDQCYCLTCHKRRGDDLYYKRGKPPERYGIPIGWCRFGLQMPMRAEYLNAPKEWHRAYHGTREDSVLPILKTGDLLQPGDVTPTGDQLGERPGHLEEDNQIGLDTKQVFVTPSVKYAAREEYASPSKFHDKEDASVHKAQVAFQVYIQPDTYERGPETVGLTTQLDPEFNNQELEWSTKRRGVILLAGVLVKLELLKKGKANKKGFGPKKSKS